jgi:hypothetical protein
MRSIATLREMLSLVHKDQEKLLDGQGMLAAPIYEEDTGRLLGMLKIEKIGFINMNVSTHETLRVVCEWIAVACSDLNRRRKLKADEAQTQKARLLRKNRVPTLSEIPEISRARQSEFG